MLKIISYQGKASQNHNKIPLNIYLLVIIKKTGNTRWCQGCAEETGTLTHCWWECKMVQPLRKTALASSSEG